jgi:hypothetical protein
MVWFLYALLAAFCLSTTDVLCKKALKETAAGDNGNPALPQGNQSFSAIPYGSFFILDPGFFDSYGFSDVRRTPGSIRGDRNFIHRRGRVSA